MSRSGWCFATVALAVTCLPSLAQETPVVTQVDGAEVRLEAKDGRTQFTLDDPITLELVFTARVPGFNVNTAGYGDMSEQVNITPADGWLRSRGPSGHDYLTTEKLEDAPIRIPVLLNQGIVFQKPGHYEISVTTARLIAPQPSPGALRLTTNTVSIDITAPDEQEEAALVRSLSARMETASGQTLHDAALQLAFLGGDEAIRAKVRWLLDPGNDQTGNVEGEMLQGLASSRNLQLQMDLLEAAWRDVQRVPENNLLEAMQQTRAFLRKQTLPGWTMVVAPPTDEAAKLAEQERRHYISEIVATLPQRTGENRRDTVYYLMEFNGLNDEEKALLRPALLSGFGQLDTVAQTMLLETRWKDIRDPSLVPDMEAMLDAPDQISSHRDALQRLIELSPEAAKPYALREICDPKSEVMLDQLAALPEQTLPEVDACLTAQLRTLSASHNHHWQWKAALAARFGSKNMLPAMREIYAARKDWNPQSDEGPFLAYFLRYSPSDAMPRIEGLGIDTQGTFFYIDKVFATLKASFPNELQTWLREQVKNGSAQQAGFAAYQLSLVGEAEDKLLVERRLEKLRQQWAGREMEIESASMTTPQAQARSLEVDLVSTLAGTDARVWTLSPHEKAALRDGCLTSDCKRHIPEAP
jgi:hypothetical protein